MKITFIQPAMHKRQAADAMQPLAYAVLKGLTPENVEVQFFDERVEELPTTFKADAVAMAVETFSAKRAYTLADSFRSQGIPVILGGFHPTLMPNEALAHADSVVIGEAEGVWKSVIADLQSGTLQKIYRQEGAANLQGLNFDRSIFAGKKYLPVFPVQFSRGCRFACDFCSIHAFFKSQVRRRPISEVVAELKNAKTVFIVDDNILSDRQEAKKLFQALIPLKIKWGCQISIDVVDDDELLSLMAESGCIAVLIGFESLSAQNLEQMGKNVNIKRMDYHSAIRKIKRHGIMIYGTFVFGYDNDTAAIVADTCDFALEQRLFLANFNPLMPMPGTRLYERLTAEGRLRYDKWWLDDKFRYGCTMFSPKRMSEQELAASCYAARKKFNTYYSIVRRACDRANAGSLAQLGIFLMANWVSRTEIYKKQGAALGGKP